MALEVTREQVRRQAQTYASDLIAFIEEQNTAARSDHEPIVRPQELRLILEHLYIRFATRWQVVLP